jgi:hypothetical protein
MVNVMFDTISKIKRCVRMAFGDSSITYQETTQKFNGILHSNGAGPTIWIMIRSPMLDRLRKKGVGVRMKLTDNSEVVIPAFAFVDDVDLIQEINKERDTAPQLIVTEWEDSLTSTGGMLVADKCRYFVENTVGKTTNGESRKIWKKKKQDTYSG